METTAQQQRKEGEPRSHTTAAGGGGRNQIWWCGMQTSNKGGNETTIHLLQGLPPLNVLKIAGGHDHTVILTGG